MSASASTYLADHNIHAILEYLCAQLVYAKPDAPLPFLADQLRKLQSKRVTVGSSSGATSVVPSSSLTMFTDADFDVMFGMMDPVGRGTLTSKQVLQAMHELGLDPAKGGVDGDADKSYNLEQFKKCAHQAQ